MQARVQRRLRNEIDALERMIRRYCQLGWRSADSV